MEVKVGDMFLRSFYDEGKHHMWIFLVIKIESFSRRADLLSVFSNSPGRCQFGKIYKGWDLFRLADMSMYKRISK